MIKSHLKAEIYSIILLVLIPVIFIHAYSDDEISLLLEKGNEFFEKQNFPDAISIYDKVLGIDPTNLDALSKKGESLLELEQTSEAIDQFEKIIQIQPSYSDDSGTPYFERTLAIDSNNINALFSRGNYLAFYDNLVEKAITTFDKILQLEPNNIEAAMKKGDALVKLGKNVEAIWSFNKALEIEPANVNALSKKGDALARQSSFEEAFLLLDKALVIEPKNTDILYLKADALRMQGNYDDSVTYFYKVLEIDPKNTLAASKLQIVTAPFGHKTVDGYMETMIHDSEGRLISHMRISPIGILNHEIAEDLVDGWPVTEIVTREGQNFEVHKFERQRDVNRDYNVWGGATHYGINVPSNDSIWLVYANYWMFLPAKGDTITYIYTVFKPVE